VERGDMMGRICLGLSLPLLLGSAQPEIPEGWISVVSKEGRFTAAMPAAPSEKKQQVKTATGQLGVVMLVAEGRDSTVFVISYADYPEAELKGSVHKRLDHARDGAVASARGTLRSEKAIDLKGHPGRDIVIEKNGETAVRARIFLVKNRLYQVMVLGAPPAGDVASFLASFGLNE
jgi:hypothetical protein